jgi:hypothetical protein
MTAWYNGIAVITTSNRKRPSHGAFISAEEIFVDSSKAVPVVIAQPREQDLFVSADRRNPHRVDPTACLFTADGLLCDFDVQGRSVPNVTKQPSPVAFVHEDKDRDSRPPLRRLSKPGN